MRRVPTGTSDSPPTDTSTLRVDTCRVGFVAAETPGAPAAPAYLTVLVDAYSRLVHGITLTRGDPDATALAGPIPEWLPPYSPTGRGTVERVLRDSAPSQESRA